VARLTLNRPERLNAFNIRMHTEVADALSQIEANATTRVLLLTGSGRAWSLPHLIGQTRALQRRCGLSEDYKEGVSAFKARRTPNFTGR
jgi:enoyl-CoA hydratase/carnithine racemase